jgi:hypothetical protein
LLTKKSRVSKADVCKTVRQEFFESGPKQTLCYKLTDCFTQEMMWPSPAGSLKQFFEGEIQNVERANRKKDWNDPDL